MIELRKSHIPIFSACVIKVSTYLQNVAHLFARGQNPPSAQASNISGTLRSVRHVNYEFNSSDVNYYRFRLKIGTITFSQNVILFLQNPFLPLRGK